MSNPTIDKHGSKIWCNEEGEYHRLDGPAYEMLYGSKEWWVTGKRHRLDGPAVEWSSGAKEWYVEGNRHRLDGPAVERVSGYKHWWVDGVEVTESGYPAAVLLFKCKQVLDT